MRSGFICAAMALAITVIFPALPDQAQAQQKRTIVGSADAVREAGMIFWKLFDKAGKEIYLLGAPYEFYDNNKKAADCIEKSIDTGQRIQITGVWKKDGNVYLLDPASVVCSPAK